MGSLMSISYTKHTQVVGSTGAYFSAIGSIGQKKKKIWTKANVLRAVIIDRVMPKRPILNTSPKIMVDVDGWMNSRF
jgi:hypothetical protein